jgi:hypothetical protein
MQAPSTEKVVIDGPAGAIEAMIERPPGARHDIVAVCCHPHPLYGGTMQNKVVHTLARASQDQRVTSVRFNFRGVGASGGRHDDAIGESEDAAVVADFALRATGAAVVARLLLRRLRRLAARDGPLRHRARDRRAARSALRLHAAGRAALPLARRPGRRRRARGPRTRARLDARGLATARGADTRRCRALLPRPADRAALDRGGLARRPGRGKRLKKP